MHLTLLVTRDGADVVLLELGAAEVLHSGGLGAMHGRTAVLVLEALAENGGVAAAQFHLQLGEVRLRGCRITRTKRFVGFTYDREEPVS